MPILLVVWIADIFKKCSHLRTERRQKTVGWWEKRGREKKREKM